MTSAPARQRASILRCLTSTLVAAVLVGGCSHPGDEGARKPPVSERVPGGGGVGSMYPAAGPNRLSDPAAFQACVDRELSRRGLNDYGDPPGTPPRDVKDRYDDVTRRFPDIRTACSTSMW